MAVYTDVAAEDLAAFLADYDIGELLAYKGIAEGVENSNFLVHASRGYFILTLYERRVAPHDLPFFLGLMEHLAARGITCPPRANHCAGVGEALPQLPLAGVDFALKRKNALSVEGWRPLVRAAAGRADRLQPALEEAIATELDQLERHWPRDLPQGVIPAA